MHVMYTMYMLMLIEVFAFSIDVTYQSHACLPVLCDLFVCVNIILTSSTCTCNHKAHYLSLTYTF